MTVVVDVVVMDGWKVGMSKAGGVAKQGGGSSLIRRGTARL